MDVDARFSMRSRGLGEDESSQSRPQPRHATLYDAVAGRVSTQGFISQPSLTPESENAAPFSSLALTPEEVLFRRLRAPTRYMENDFYFANEDLPPHHSLPDSDLLKAIHTYSSDFYRHATADRGSVSWRSMDETALIGLGILLEELAKDSLGETGDMVFAEGEQVSSTETPVPEGGSAPRSTSRKRAGTSTSIGFGRVDNDLVTLPKRTKKRRRQPKPQNDSPGSDAAET